MNNAACGEILEFFNFKIECKFFFHLRYPIQKMKGFFSKLKEYRSNSIEIVP